MAEEKKLHKLIGPDGKEYLFEENGQLAVGWRIDGIPSLYSRAAPSSGLPVFWRSVLSESRVVVRSRRGDDDLLRGDDQRAAR